MTDAEHAAVLRRLVAYDWHETDKAAIERAIELLEREAANVEWESGTSVDVVVSPTLKWTVTDAPDSIRDLIADVLVEVGYGALAIKELPDAILAHPDIKAIIDLAAWSATTRTSARSVSPEVRALLADWRTS